MDETNTSISTLAAEGTEAKSSGILNHAIGFSAGVGQMAVAALILQGGEQLYNKVTGRGEKLKTEAKDKQEKRDAALALRITDGFVRANTPVVEGLKDMTDAIRESTKSAKSTK